MQWSFWTNFRIVYDEEEETYTVMVDNLYGDKGHPLVVTYWKEVAEACKEMLEAKAENDSSNGR